MIKMSPLGQLFLTFLLSSVSQLSHLTSLPPAFSSGLCAAGGAVSMDEGKTRAQIRMERLQERESEVTINGRSTSRLFPSSSFLTHLFLFSYSHSLSLTQHTLLFLSPLGGLVEAKPFESRLRGVWRAWVEVTRAPLVVGRAPRARIGSFPLPCAPPAPVRRQTDGGMLL